MSDPCPECGMQHETWLSTVGEAHGLQDYVRELEEAFVREREVEAPLRSEVVLLRARIAELEEALMPFAGIGLPYKRPEQGYYPAEVKNADIARARRALGLEPAP